jgi:hypothetical protein
VRQLICEGEGSIEYEKVDFFPKDESITSPCILGDPKSWHTLAKNTANSHCHPRGMDPSGSRGMAVKRELGAVGGVYLHCIEKKKTLLMIISKAILIDNLKFTRAPQLSCDRSTLFSSRTSPAESMEAAC